ncbi:MAG: hypothetical protein MHM6MM_009565, partial [Cercozoa sp. M6MM]
HIASIVAPLRTRFPFDALTVLCSQHEVEAHLLCRGGRFVWAPYTQACATERDSPNAQLDACGTDDDCLLLGPVGGTAQPEMPVADTGDTTRTHVCRGDRIAAANFTDSNSTSIADLVRASARQQYCQCNTATAVSARAHEYPSCDRCADLFFASGRQCTTCPCAYRDGVLDGTCSAVGSAGVQCACKAGYTGTVCEVHAGASASAGAAVGADTTSSTSGARDTNLTDTCVGSAGF